MNSWMLYFPSAWCQSSCTSVAVCLVLLTIFCPTMISCTKPEVSYSEHCGSIVTGSVPTESEYATVPFPPNQDGYYLGGDEILNRSSSTQFHYSIADRRTLLFITHHVRRTAVEGLYRIEGDLVLQPSGMSYYFDGITYSYSYSPQVIPMTSESSGLSFELEGFWSKSTSKLCMVGFSSSSSQDGMPNRVLSVRLKLDGVQSSSTITSLVRGTLESLSSGDDSSQFEPLSLLMFPVINYKYTEVSKDADNGCSGGVDLPKKLSLSLPLSKPICSVFSRSFNSFELEYSSNCSLEKGGCSPLGADIGYLPRGMSFSSLHCSDDRQTLRFLIEFSESSSGHYYHPFFPNASLVAEGSWDAKKNQICIVACRISNPSGSLNDSHIEDCSMRLSLRFPAIWSVGNTSAMEGSIWSNKTLNETGHFSWIKFRSSGNRVIDIQGLKYEYTMVDRAKESCPKKKPDERKQYPDGNSYDMRFHLSVKNSSPKRIGWGYSEPLFVGDKVSSWSRSFIVMSSTSSAKSKSVAKTGNSSPVNISYIISLPSLNGSSDNYPGVQISAEGIYDAETGVMCLVGCRYITSDSQASPNDTMDCEILFKLQFPPFNSNKRIEGSVESTRKASDPLYFKSLSFSATSNYIRHAEESIWRMDLEIILALMSNTLVCIFVGCQILYARKRRNVFPFISLLMLAVLILGHLLPLVLNFEALFLAKQDRRHFHLRRSGGWLEVNEVMVRVVTMLAFLLQLRLLQHVWSARSADGVPKASCSAEKRTLYISLPLYIAGGLIAFYVNRGKYKLGEEMRSSSYYGQQNSIWTDLRSYAGLLLDGFLFPQILFNLFRNSKESVLSPFFYMGTTMVRLLPHAYDLYRARFYGEDFDWSYSYASPGADYYSTAWDIIIPLVCLLFAAAIYLQQRFGGRCLLPQRFKQLEGYEKVPLANEA